MTIASIDVRLGKAANQSQRNQSAISEVLGVDQRTPVNSITSTMLKTRGTLELVITDVSLSGACEIVGEVPGPEKLVRMFGHILQTR
jgi:hypothetical protein